MSTAQILSQMLVAGVFMGRVFQCTRLISGRKEHLPAPVPSANPDVNVIIVGLKMSPESSAAEQSASDAISESPGLSPQTPDEMRW